MHACNSSTTTTIKHTHTYKTVKSGQMNESARDVLIIVDDWIIVCTRVQLNIRSISSSSRAIAKVAGIVCSGLIFNSLYKKNTTRKLLLAVRTTVNFGNIAIFAVVARSKLPHTL